MEFHFRSIQKLWSKLPAKAFYLFYTIVYLAMLPLFQHQTDVDTIGYIAAAEYYAENNIYDGINGYWSPLLSWLLVPFIWLHTPPLLAIKLINLGAGIAGLRLVKIIAHQFNLGKSGSHWSMLITMPHFIMFSLCAATPDVLACVSWLAVAYCVLRLFSSTDHFTIANLAFAGAVAYFAKYYHFYAFILLLLVLLIKTRLFMKNKTVANAILQAMVLFLLISSAWIGALYLKYGTVTPTTAARHNLYTSQLQDKTNIPQMGKQILPLNYEKYRYTAWEYVPDYISTVAYSLNHQPGFSAFILSKVPENLIKGPKYFYIETFLFLLSLVIFITAKAFRSNIYFSFLLIILIYPLGYFLTTIDYRYLLFCVVALLLLSVLAYHQAKSMIVRYIMITLLAASFLLPFHRIHRFQHKGGDYFEMNAYFNRNNRLKDVHIMSSPSAWSRAIGLVYQSDARYYDTLLPELLETNESSLKTSHINWYLCLTSEIPQHMKKQYAIDQYGTFALIYLGDQ